MTKNEVILFMLATGVAALIFALWYERWEKRKGKDERDAE